MTRATPRIYILPSNVEYLTVECLNCVMCRSFQYAYRSKNLPKLNMPGVELHRKLRRILQNTWNLVISSCCCAGYSKERYKRFITHVHNYCANP